MRMIILRGVSGSGKTTRAEELKAWAERSGKQVEICSTDSFFMKDGTYQFNPTKLGEYHAKNLNKAMLALSYGKCVIIDNTNTTWKEIEPYVRLAKLAGADLNFEELSGDLVTCWQRNVHGVPQDVIEKQGARYESMNEIYNHMMNNNLY